MKFKEFDLMLEIENQVFRRGIRDFLNNPIALANKLGEVFAEPTLEPGEQAELF
jgi:hypothetical protein